MGVSGDLRIVVAGPDPLVRAGLHALLAAESGCDVVGEIDVKHHDAAVPMSAAPDVIVYDGGRDAGALAGELAALEAFEVPVLAVLPDTGAGRAALAAGARGYVGRNAGGERLAVAVRAVAAGLQVSEPSDRPHDEPLERDTDAAVEELTPRELEVLQLLAEGLPNKGVARRLRISEHTVKFHVTAIMSKLHTHSRTETVTRAARAGLILL
jgi:DNA-binding NarL/FixJ family response regulator